MQVHPKVAAILIGGGGKPLKELEEETGRHFHFHGTEHSPLDTFQITAEGTREEIEHRALPFSKGEEVLIKIEEPHMYNEDDAIAKIDGYVISIAGGGPHVGQKKLIRIEEVKRTAAYAVVVSDNGAGEDRAEPVEVVSATEVSPNGAEGEARLRRVRAARRSRYNRPAPRASAAVAAEAAGGVRAQRPATARRADTNPVLTNGLRDHRDGR